MSINTKLLWKRLYSLGSRPSIRSSPDCGEMRAGHCGNALNVPARCECDWIGTGRIGASIAQELSWCIQGRSSPSACATPRHTRGKQYHDQQRLSCVRNAVFARGRSACVDARVRHQVPSESHVPPMAYTSTRVQLLLTPAQRTSREQQYARGGEARVSVL
jgi:hypothetical protein